MKLDKSSGSGTWRGWALIAFLSVAVLWTFAGVGGEPAATKDGLPFDARQALEKRFEEYKTLRLAGDWDGLYDLVQPAHRERVDRAAFLGFYDHGLLRTDSVEVMEITLVPEQSSAVVQVKSTGEILVARLPARYRAGFQMPEDPADLQRTLEYDMTWVWSDGWFFELDDAIVAGANKDGRAIERVKT